jgi:hypothetical protein
METVRRVGSRYLGDGLVIAEWSSHLHGPDSVDDHIIKRLCATAQEVPKRPGVYDLVGFVEIDVVAIENGEDEGFIELPTHEVYRAPFPYGVRDRKRMLRQMCEEPKFHLVL